MSDYSAIIRKGEIFVRRWNSEIRAHEEKRKTEQVLSDILQFPLTLEGTTFGQFFALIAKEKSLYEQVFKAALYGHPLDGFIKEAEMPAKTCKDVDYVRVHWCGELYDGEITMDPAFGGWGNWSMEGGPEKGGIAMEFTPLYEYKDLELRLDTDGDIYSLEQKGPLIRGKKTFTVYDVVNAILFEITWAGDVSKGRDGCPVCKDGKKCALCEGKKGEQAA